MPQDTDLISSLEVPLKALRGKRIAALLQIAATLGAAAMLSYFAIRVGDFPVGVLWVAVIIAFGIVPFILKRFKKTAAGLIIPPLAETVGLRYQAVVSKDLTHGWMKTGLLPSTSTISRSEDGFAGEFAGRSFQTADLRIETGGKSSETKFNGLVVSLDLTEPHHWFVLAKESDTTGGFFSRPKVGTKDLIKTTGHKSITGQWFFAFVPDPALAEDPAFQRRMDTLVRLNWEIPECELFSVVCTGRQVLVALSHETDFFRLRVLLGTANLGDELRRVLAEMQAVLKVAGIVLESETGVSPDAAAAPPEVSDAAPEAE